MTNDDDGKDEREADARGERELAARTRRTRSIDRSNGNEMKGTIDGMAKDDRSIEWQ